MDMKAFEITTKMIVGENTTEEEKSYARNYNAKYAIVRHLILEKKPALKNFHFTPGEDFVNTPTIDVVNSIIKSFSEFKLPLDFGDSSHLVNKYGDPLKTDKVKTILGDHSDLLDTQKES
jgi:hypothetical protein